MSEQATDLIAARSNSVQNNFYAPNEERALAPRRAGSAGALTNFSPARGALSSEALFSFPLRGNSLNPLIDCTSPLVALILRIFTLSHYENIDMLHKKCRHEIESIELELQKLGHDRVTILALRYCLCSVIDEAVMCSAWGQNSNWAERSLLALYHDETWGGEKYFVILERLMMEASHYIEILEFLYLCLCLGYEGKYRPRHNGRMQLEALIKEVHAVIRKERGEPSPLFLHDGQHIAHEQHQLRWQTPIAVVLGGAFLVALVLYLGYFFYTDNFTTNIIIRLNEVLEQSAGL